MNSPFALWLLLALAGQGQAYEPAKEIFAHVPKVPQSAKCSDLDGVNLYEKYGAEPYSWHNLCGSYEEKSWFKCAMDSDASPSNVEDYLCHGQNLQISAPKEQVEFFGDRDDGKLADMHIAGCKTNTTTQLSLSEIFGWKLSLHLLGAENSSCSPETAQHGNFLAMVIVDTWNPFEGMHQPLMAFASMAALNFDLKSTRLVYVRRDKRTSPMIDFTETVLSPGGPALHLSGGPVCLQNVIVPISGRKAFLNRNVGTDDPTAAECSASPVLLGFVDHIKASFRVGPPSRGKPFRVSILSRRNSPHNLGQARRVMENADEVVSALRGRQETAASLIAADGAATSDSRVHAPANSKSFLETGKGAMYMDAITTSVAKTLKMLHSDWQVEMLDPPELSMQKQVEIFSDTDLLIGPHGASLTWSMLLTPCGQLLEFVDGGDYHYFNVAHYLGKKHNSLQGPFGWGSSGFRANVDETLAKVEQIFSEWNTCNRNGI